MHFLGLIFTVSMHELTLIKNIFSSILEVAAKNNLHRLSKVTLQIGRLRQVVPEFLQFAFVNTAKNTIAENAVLEIEFIPITVLCNNCQKQFTVTKQEQAYICPKCQSTKLEIISGKELIIKSLEGAFV